MDVLAIDIGGTKVTIARVDHTGLVGDELRVPTMGSAKELIDNIIAAGQSLLTGHQQACGVGTCGPLRDGLFVSPVNIPVWREFPIQQALADGLGIPTYVDGDGKALALAEGWKGEAIGHSNYISMVVSTGIGGGIVLNGQLLHGRTGAAGHIGHVVVEPRGHRCGCGTIGCVEAEASGTAIKAITGRPAQDASAEVRAQTGRLVGRAVGIVANLLDLPLATIGGSVALGFGDAFFGPAQIEATERCQMTYSRDVRIVPTGLGDDGPIIGAAAVALRRVGLA